ncbi:MAG: type II toxin-antitoxin system VapC family toxin [Candidatus Electrothrix sp. Rat3]|nr:type II toxin-antitoxin system VapC family toxin [Candidatus Electrothrix rattekaaiensis]
MGEAASVVSIVSVVYWDASAALSLLFDDIHSKLALQHWNRKRTVHLLSSLAYVEIAAVIGRLERTGSLSTSQAETAYAHLNTRGWRRTNILPDYDIIVPYSRCQPLRGADLWHLTCACTLQKDLPELRLLTFDHRLHEAAAGAGVAVSL